MIDSYRKSSFIISSSLTDLPSDCSNTSPEYLQCDRYRLGECYCEHRCHPDFEQRCFGYLAYDRNGNRKF